MTVSDLGIYSLMGWYTEASCVKEGVELSNIPGYNMYRISGYLPVVGICAGISGIKLGIEGSNETDEGGVRLDLGARIYSVVRGILEIVGLGLLFLIPDLAVSVHRHFLTESNVKKV